MENFLKLGEHYMCELWGCDSDRLNDNELMKAALLRAITASNLSIVSEGHFDFQPHGLSYFVMLEESHTSLHAWPEHDYCAVDLFICSLEADTNPFFAALQEDLAASHVLVRKVDRGFRPKELQQQTTTSLTFGDLPAKADPQKQPWGWHLVLNLYECDAAAIRSQAGIEQFVVELCDRSEIRRFGDPTVIHFGDDPEIVGYSLLQLVESSNVAGHFSEKYNSAYLDIFSCKQFDPESAMEFCVETFQAKRTFGQFIRRG